MYYCSYKSGFLSILHNIGKQNMKKQASQQFDEVSEESKVTAETDLYGSSVDGGMQLVSFPFNIQIFRVTSRNLH